MSINSDHPTAGYFERLKANQFHPEASRTLGATPYVISRIGFGGYRITDNSREHAMALQKALLSGCNLVDTSSNYMDGASEMLIGEVLRDMTEMELIDRNEVVIVTKGGYVQGSNLKQARESAKKGAPIPEITEYSDQCWHSIHPQYLERQLQISLDRLRVACIDIYMLHNPEYFLAAGWKNGERDIHVLRDEYYRRIREAFRWMEAQVAAGRIRWYGVSSNTLPASADDPEFTSLERLLETAQAVATDHHFAVIEFPLNLFEQHACFVQNHAKNTRTLLETAQAHHIGTLINRPLNAMTPDGIVRLANFRLADPQVVRDDFRTCLSDVVESEETYELEIANTIPSGLLSEQMQSFLQLSQHLKTALDDYRDWMHWDQTRQQFLLNGMGSLFQTLQPHLTKQKSWLEWGQAHIVCLGKLLDTIALYYECGQQLRSQNISNDLEMLNAAMEESPTLSQKTLRLLQSLPGVDCVLVGMRQPQYVDDALAILKIPDAPNALETLRELEL
jgi:uncharacterized protein